MWNESADKILNELIPKDRILRDEPMYKHTTFKAGGPAGRFVSVAGSDELVSILDGFGGRDEDIFILGHGSNLLVSDRGYDGLVLELGRQTARCEVDGSVIISDAGTMLMQLATTARDNALSGLEFAGGIPGTLGGAVYMNAGAYGGEMSDVITSVKVYDRSDGTVKDIDNKAMDFSYRHSVIKDSSLVVISAKLSLSEGDREEIDGLMKDYNSRRREKQPFEYASAGSTFKRPEGYYAGALIEQSGLKGYSVGDAQVSEKHAGFVINRGNASATDIYRLIMQVSEKVYETTGVRLEPEVGFLGDFS